MFPNVRNLVCRSFDADTRHLFWEIEDTSSDVLDFEVEVQRSESAGGPWEVASPRFRDRYHFLDANIPLYHRHRQLHYKLVFTHLPTGEQREVGPVMMEPSADLYAMEIRRHMQLLFREFAGRRCWALPVRTFGPRCPVCWNATLGARAGNSARCLSCFSTGFLRGYMHPIEVWASVEPNAKTQTPTGIRVATDSNTVAKLGYYPPLKPEDILVEAENRRWRVTKVVQTEQSRAALSQELELHEIGADDIVYKLPLNLNEEVKDAIFSPARNFTNPHNLDNELQRWDLLVPNALKGRRG